MFLYAAPGKTKLPIPSLIGGGELRVGLSTMSVSLLILRRYLYFTSVKAKRTKYITRPKRRVEKHKFVISSANKGFAKNYCYHLLTCFKYSGQ